MHSNYEDITSRIKEEPTWYDCNGAPRYGKFSLEACPNIYAHQVVLLEIACQSCGAKFLVEMNGDGLNPMSGNPKKLHYGDPPAHGCVGDTMNCEDIAVIEVWHRSWERKVPWKRLKKLEGSMEG
jgi:hypothetical protein